MCFPPKILKQKKKKEEEETFPTILRPHFKGTHQLSEFISFRIFFVLSPIMFNTC